MKSILIGVLMGVVILLMVSSCATVPTEPPAPGEVRLLGVKFAGFQPPKKALRYVVEIKFESDGQVDVTRACFYWDDNGPSCYNIMEISYGTRTISALIDTPPVPGNFVLRSYVQFIKDKRALRSNIVQTSVEITP